MAEYLSTGEVATYLRLNGKKVHALVAEGKMPASRVCGNWLFPRHLIDRWVDHHTRLPVAARMEALLDDLLIVQGSDDILPEEEAFRLARLTRLASHPRMARFLGFTLDHPKKHSAGATEGYQFDISGQLEVCGPQAPETLPQPGRTPT